MLQYLSNACENSKERLLLAFLVVARLFAAKFEAKSWQKEGFLLNTLSPSAHMGIRARL